MRVTRLPTPGSDDGKWGDILNDFLSQAHNSDGTLKANIVDVTMLASGSGTDGQVLTKDSSQTGGIKWATNPSAPVTSVNTQTGAVVLTKTDIGLGNVDNTSDANKPVSTATQTALNAKAPLASPTFTGTVTVPTPTNNTDAATKAYVDTAASGLANKADKTTTFSAGTGLTGGGDLSTNRTISANFGTTAGTVAQGNHTHTLTFSLTSFYKSGTLSVTTGTQLLPVDGTYTIVGTRLTAGTAPVGAAIIVDVNKNGTTIYTTQANRPTIADGAQTGGPGSAPDVTALSAGDYLSVDIDQVGSSTAGSDLTVSVIVSKTVQ